MSWGRGGHSGIDPHVPHAPIQWRRWRALWHGAVTHPTRPARRPFGSADVAGLELNNDG